MTSTELVASEFMSLLRDFDDDKITFPEIVRHINAREMMAHRRNALNPNPVKRTDNGLVHIHSLPISFHLRELKARGTNNLEAECLFTRVVKPRPYARFEPVITSGTEFSHNWSTFTNHCLTYLSDWSNVVAAGGSVQQCLVPIPSNYRKSSFSRWKFFRAVPQSDSDLDLFIYGLNDTNAALKAFDIFRCIKLLERDAVQQSSPYGCTIHFRTPYRKVQVIYMKATTPLEVLHTFDIDSCCCIYDGTEVLVSPRGIIAFLWRTNTVDISRRSFSYESRLAKYATRGFQVFIPGFRRADVDPDIFERALTETRGLARLLRLEKSLSTKLTRQTRGIILRHIVKTLNEIDYAFLEPEITNEIENAEWKALKADPSLLEATSFPDHGASELRRRHSDEHRSHSFETEAEWRLTASITIT